MKLIEISAPKLPSTLDELFPSFNEIREILSELKQHGIDYNAANEMYQELRSRFQRFPMTVWRGVLLSDIEELETEQVGPHWTYDRKAAIAYLSREKKPDPTLSLHVLEATVPSEQVHWKNTIAYNLLIPHEKEIYLQKGARVLVNRIHTQDGVDEYDQVVTV